MCKFFDVSRSGYYAFISRINRSDKDEMIAQMIATCQIKYGRTYGCRRVQIWLKREKNISRNYKTIWRIMNKYGLLAGVRRRRFKNVGQQLHQYENLLNRDFSAQLPNQKWVTDISYIQTGQGTLYLSIIRDLFDNSIVAYKTNTRQNVKLVLDTIQLALDKEVVTEELQLHSDQGFQYTSHEYFNLVKSYGITPSMSRRANPYDNAMAENFFSILKAECIRRTKIKTFSEAKALIDNYIYFYNYERIQIKTKLTPYEKRCQLI
jgi:putative transposase